MAAAKFSYAEPLRSGSSGAAAQQASQKKNPQGEGYRAGAQRMRALSA
jgi:hypothetical protein